MDLALPHRQLRARSGRLAVPPPLRRGPRRGRLHDRVLPARRPANGASRVDPPGDRPVRDQEHGAAARPLPPGDGRRRRQPPRAGLAPGLPLRPLEGPAGRHPGLSIGQAGAARGAVGARRRHGRRRPRGLVDPGGDQRRGRAGPRPLRVQQPDRRGQHGGQRLPARRGRDPAEVAARGLRPGRLGGALEGAAGRRRRRGRHPDAVPRRVRGQPGGRRRAVRRADAVPVGSTPRTRPRSAGPARRRSAASSCCRGSSATSCGSGGTSWLPEASRLGWSPPTAPAARRRQP